MAPSLEESKPYVYRRDRKTIFEHICVDDRFIEYSLPDVIWTVASEIPLTIGADINCGFCGLRGRFVEGTWLPLSDGPIAGRANV